MSALRTLAALSLLSAVAPAATAACSTDAVGVEDCRDIEFARCEAASACGAVQDEDDCKRFYRDHCLHGLALEEEPSGAVVQTCVRSPKAVAACNADTALADCPGVTTSPSALPLACDVVRAPEDIEECRFLVPATPAPPPTPDAGTDANPAADATID